MNNLRNQVKKAKQASIILASIKTEIKNRALENIIKEIKKNKNEIIKENKKDLQKAKENELSNSLIERLVVDDKKIREIIEMVESIIKLEDPIGKILEITELDKDLILSKVTVPIGLIGAIFESRPDAAVQISSLCIKSGNAVILKGGSEASNTNRILVNLIREAIKNYVPKEAVQIIETRAQVKEILKLDEYIDLLIPRGSNKFVKYIQDNTKIPVLGHSEGICHVYVDIYADIKKASDICYDAKCQYPAVCNAMETLLVHKAIANKFLPLMIKKFKKAGVEIKGDEKTRSIVKNIKKSTEKDWKTEYNDLILNIKIVKNVDEAIEHINYYGSRHTDAIVTENQKTASKFIDFVDSSSIMHNCSTRFADGFRYGKGAEVGISTAKIHARGPVGVEGLTIYKYILKGQGNTLKEYSSGKKKFTHKIKKMKNKIIIKIGTNVLTDKIGILDYKVMERIVKDIAEIKKKGKDIIIVTSGAIGAGMAELNIEKRPRDIKLQQACAAVGQSILMSKYKEFFNKHKIKVAQILLTYNDFSDKKGYINFDNSIKTILELDAIPIINENDPVSINELGPSFGDNDRLSAMVASKIGAKMLIILTTVDGLYDKNPKFKGAKILKEVYKFDEKLENLTGSSSMLGVGGVKTKIIAAKIATSAGILTIVANGKRKNIISDINKGKKIGTMFYPRTNHLGKKRWIQFIKSKIRL